MHDYDQYDNPKDYPETPEWYHDDPDYGRSAWPRTLALIVMCTFLLAMLFAAGWGLTDIVSRLAGWL